jgi:EmrB/QacA subfamily drug resistance transporter
MRIYWIEKAFTPRYWKKTCSGEPMEEIKPISLDPKKIPLVMGGIMLGLLIAALDGTIVSTVMPTIIHDLQGMEFYVWPFAMYLLTSTLAILVFGKFSDLYGRKRIFLFGIGVFLAGSILCGLAPGMVWLILFRGIQGIGGGILTTLAFIIVAEMFPVQERARYIGILASVFGIASIIGPILGGFITDTVGWRWVFYINIPLGIIAASLILAELPETAMMPEKREIDVLGIASFCSGMVPLFIALSCGGTILPWTSPVIAGLLILSALLLAIFIRTERHAQNPILPLYLFENSVYTSTAIAAFLSNALMFAGIIYLPLFMQDVLKTSAGTAGLIITPMVLALVVAAVVSGRVISSTRRYKPAAVAGFAILGAGILMLAFLTPVSSVSFIVIASILVGYGSGTLHPVLAIAAQNALPPRDLGVVSSSQQFFRNMGATLLTPLFGFVMYAGLGQQVDRKSLDLLPADVLAHAIQLVFISCIVIVAVSLVLMLLLEEIPLRSRQRKEEPAAAAE